MLLWLVLHRFWEKRRPHVASGDGDASNHSTEASGPPSDSTLGPRG
jgi:hypothetical protein